MNSKDISMLKVLVKSTLDHCTRSGLTPEELQYLYNMLENKQHVEEVHHFKQQLQEAMPVDFDDESALEFYEKEFTISFGKGDRLDAMVTLPNGATVYQGIQDLIDEYIENDL